PRIRRKLRSASRNAAAAQRLTISPSRQRVTRWVLRRALELGFSIMLVLPSARHKEGESPSRLMVNSSSKPSRRLPAASGYSRSSQEACWVSLAIPSWGFSRKAASIALARKGRGVTFIEREPTPRHKVCGEFLSGEALEDLHALGIDVSSLGAVPIDYVRLAAARRAAEAPLPFPAASLTRKALDT